MQYPEHPSVKPPSPAESRTGENDELSIARNLVATLGPSGRVTRRSSSAGSE